MFKTRKAATATEMALLLSVIAVALLAAMQGLGLEISKALGLAENALEENAPAANPSEGGQNETPLFAFTTHTFTNCGASGQQGPLLSACRGAYATSWDENASFFDMSTRGYQVWTVPETASYQITAVGAQGGRSTASNQAGGSGASAAGVVTLNRGEKIVIVVGQAGSASNSGQHAGGGGGGSFAWRQSSAAEPLVAGGGGSGGNLVGAGQSGRLTSDGGNNGALFINLIDFAGIGGTNGSGGQISRENTYGGGAGGGFKGDGEARTNSFGDPDAHIYGGDAGKGRTGNFVGGDGGASNLLAIGGFGGGGGGSTTCGGSGAGGGYSGGGAASCWSISGGGGSYVDSAATGATISAGSGTHGRVVITKQ